MSLPSLHREPTDTLIASISHLVTHALYLLCHSAGFIVWYSMMQFILLWIMHISFIFWKIYFPMSTILKNIRRTKYIHGICLIAAVLLPLISPMASHLKDGFVIGSFPPFFCVGNNNAVSFYTLLLPLNILLGVGTSLLVLMFWRLHMV